MQLSKLHDEHSHSRRASPEANRRRSWANYLLLPITVPADIAISPIQIPAYISYTRGEQPSRVVPMEASARDWACGL